MTEKLREKRGEENDECIPHSHPLYGNEWIESL